jgi:hypothetical protein
MASRFSIPILVSISVCVEAIATVIARPKAEPIWYVVFTTLDAMPVSSFFTFDIATVNDDIYANDIPRTEIIDAGNT